MKKLLIGSVVLWGMALLVVGCAGGRKLAVVKEEGITAAVAAGSLDDVLVEPFDSTSNAEVEVIEVEDLQGNTIIMNAVKDEESGEMVATEQLNEIVVQARFRHVAERNGLIDLVFEIMVPAQLQKDMWQVRFTPYYCYLGDTLEAEKIFVTGERFRKVQNWEYMMYRNYARGVLSKGEAGKKYGLHALADKFEQRYGFDDGASGHYRIKFLDRINRHKEEAKERIFNRFVVDPFPVRGVRIDSVLYDKSSDGLRYFYVQTIQTKAGLRKVDMVMKGEVYTNGRKLCDLAGTEPITFYISSISSFVDNTERYLKKVVNRDLYLDTQYEVEFYKGKWNVDERLASNGSQLHRMKGNIREILGNEDFVMDSIHIAPSCSPEGKLRVNEKLSRQRGEAIKEFVTRYIAYYRDSVESSVWEINEDAEYAAKEDSGDEFDSSRIRITEVSEEWGLLRELICRDTVINGKEELLECYGIEDLDAREAAVRKHPQAKYIVEELYPKLRLVKLGFKLHRKGMLKDTVHTTELDSVYMSGVRALRDRDYKTAVTLLRPYNCYNTAVAYVCMDYNQSALEVLQTLPRDARRDYMLAVVYSRLGDERLAVEYFLASVEQDSSMRHRGNLDPEISSLIKKYGIFNNF